MSEQLHITHRKEYLAGRAEGKHDASNGERYARLPTDTNPERAFAQGYTDGWMEVIVP